MNTVDPKDPRRLDPEQEAMRQDTFYRDADRGEGMGAIIGVVAIAALIIIGMLYIMQPPADTPGSVTGQGPSTTTPAPTPAPSKTPEPGK